ncbi:MAG: hypothetical protein Q9210_006493, partial [Variospora velana]
MDPTKNAHPDSQGAVPPYEPNPAYTQQQPHMQHQESYNNAPIQPYPQQHQYPQHEQQQYPSQPMASPPMDPPKQGYYASEQPQATTTLQHQPSMPMQQQQQSGYQTATPLANLQDAAAPADCPACRMRALTKIEFHSGNTT